MPAGAAEAVVIGTEGSNPALEAATRATIVEAAIAKPDGQIRSGVFATAHVALGENERAVFVPRDAVIASTAIVGKTGRRTQNSASFCMV